MTVRKDLVAAALAGAALSTAGCLLVASRNTLQSLPAQEISSKIRDEKRQEAPFLPPVVTQDSPADKPPVSTNAPTTAAAHRAKPVKIARTPVIAPKPAPPQTNMARPLLTTPQEASAAPPVPIAQNPDGTMSAQMITPQEARIALGKVGADPEAEAVWIAAINDSNMPAKQRKDLIEDLNEEGFANPKNLTAADLPRIEKRIALIEELAPEAIDQTNADAFQEAYKDLKNMQSRLNKP